MNETRRDTYKAPEKITKVADLQALMQKGWGLIEHRAATNRGRNSFTLAHGKFRTLPEIWVTGAPVQKLDKAGGLRRVGVLDRWGDGSPAKVLHLLQK